jgi:serine/threonine-protein kinase RIO1
VDGAVGAHGQAIAQVRLGVGRGDGGDDDFGGDALVAQAQGFFQRDVIEGIGRELDAIGDHAGTIRLDLDADVVVHDALVADQDFHLMDLVTDEFGHSAPRLGEVDLPPAVARLFHHELIHDVVRMLCVGWIHGDLSEYNVLVAESGPVIIDFPQVVSASGNNNARKMLLRDVHNLRDSLARFAPELAETHYGEEMWALYEKGELKPDTPLTGKFVFNTRRADVRSVMMSIEDARQEAIIRQQGREEAAQD